MSDQPVALATPLLKANRSRVSRFPVLRIGVQNTTLVGTKAARLTHGRGASGLVLCGALRKNVRKLDCDSDSAQVEDRRTVATLACILRDRLYVEAN